MAITAYNLGRPRQNCIQSLQFVWENSLYQVFDVKIPRLQDPVVSGLIQSELIKAQRENSPHKKDRQDQNWVKNRLKICIPRPLSFPICKSIISIQGDHIKEHMGNLIPQFWKFSIIITGVAEDLRIYAIFLML